MFFLFYIGSKIHSGIAVSLIQKGGDPGSLAF